MAQQYKTGDLVGNWMVLGETIGKGWKKKILCRCLCEKQTERYLHLNRLRSGRTLSCGCKPKIGTQNNQSRTKSYAAWRSMIERCFNKKHKSYSYYGGRGIRVCDRWLENYSNFLLDMGEPDKNMTLDRIDCDGNYEPNNCRWVTWKVQQNNRRSTLRVYFRGANRTLWEISKMTGINQDVIYSRYLEGVDFEAPYKSLNRISVYFRGANRTLREISEITGININTIRSRYRVGLSFEADYIPRKNGLVDSF